MLYNPLNPQTNKSHDYLVI